MNSSALLFSHIHDLLTQLLQFSAPADRQVSLYFRNNPQLGHRDRGLLAEAVFMVLRQRAEFLYFIEQFPYQTPETPETSRQSAQHEHHCLALLSLSKLARQDFWAPHEKEWLDQINAIDRSTLSPRLLSNLPDWIYDALLGQFDENTVTTLAAALNKTAPLDCRVNTFKSNREEILAALNTEEATHAEACPWAPHGVRFIGKPALQHSDFFRTGQLEAQDEGSQLLCELVAPKRGEMVVDFCAGAGGKTLALGAMMRSTGRLYAFDVSEKRLSKLKPRLARSGLSNVHPVRIDNENDTKVKRLAGKIDRVLIDAPCSGLGTLRRNPDLKWRQTPNDVQELSVKQLSILNSAARLLKKGGRLVYATCSLLADENQNVIAAFLEKNPKFALVSASKILEERKLPVPNRIPSRSEDDPYFELFPHLHNTDGFFAAVMQRIE